MAPTRDLYDFWKVDMTPTRKFFRFLQLVCPIHISECCTSIGVLYVPDTDTALTLKCLYFIG